MHIPPSHMNCGSHHKFNQWDPQLCEMREYAFMILWKYLIITLLQRRGCSGNYICINGSKFGLLPLGLGLLYTHTHTYIYVKCTPPQIEGFTWSRHLFNLKGKIRKPSIKNTSVVLMYMTIYIKFCYKNLQCFFVLDTI